MSEDREEYERWRDYFLRWNLKIAYYDGNVDAAKELIRETAETIEKKQDIPAPLLIYILTAFNAVLRGERPQKALMLARPAGRPPNAAVRAKRDRDQRLVGRMLEKMRTGCSKGRAANEVIAELELADDLSQRQAERIFDENTTFNKK